MIDQLERRMLCSAQTPTIVAELTDTSYSAIVHDTAGNSYGTYSGETTGDAGGIFEVPAGTDTPQLLASFGPVGDANVLGQGPGQLVIDAHGNLFGITGAGGDNSSSGTLWTLAAGSPTIKVLVNFDDDAGVGYEPGGLVMDASGDLFGWTTQAPRGTPVTNGGIFEYPADGSGIRFLGTLPGISAMVADSSGDVFGISFRSENYGDFAGEIFEVPGGASKPKFLAIYDKSAFDATGICMDARHDLFLTTGGGVFEDGAVVELPAHAHAVKVLASLSSPYSLVDGVSAPLIDSKGNIFAAAVDSSGGSQVLELPAGGTSMQPVIELGQFQSVSLDFGIDGTIIGLEQNLGSTSVRTGNIFEFTPPAVVEQPAPLLFGNVAGRSNVARRFALSGGGTARFSLVGPGKGIFTPDADGGFDVSFIATTLATKASITLLGNPTQPVLLDDLSDPGSIYQLIAPNVNLKGSFYISGGIHTLSIGNMTAASLFIGRGSTSVRAQMVSQSIVTTHGNLAMQVLSGSGCNVSAAEITQFVCQGDFSGTLGCDTIDQILICGNISNSILTGFGKYEMQYEPPDDDAQYIVKSFTVLGSMTSTTVVPGGFDNSGVLALPGSQIGSIYVGGAVDSTSRFVAFHFPTTAFIDGRKMETKDNPLFSS